MTQNSFGAATLIRNTHFRHPASSCLSQVCLLPGRSCVRRENVVELCSQLTTVNVGYHQALSRQMSLEVETVRYATQLPRFSSLGVTTNKRHNVDLRSMNQLNQGYNNKLKL